MSVCVKRNDSASVARAKSGLLLFFLFLKSLFHMAGINWREHEKKSIFLFSLLLVGTCSATGAALPDSLSKAEPQKEFRAVLLYENRVFSPKAEK